MLSGLVHAGKDCSVDPPGGTDPGTITEGLIYLEVGEVSEVKGAAALDTRSRSDLALGVPGKKSPRFKGSFPFLQGSLYLVPESLIEWDMKKKVFPGLCLWTSRDIAEFMDLDTI